MVGNELAIASIRTNATGSKWKHEKDGGVAVEVFDPVAVVDAAEHFDAVAADHAGRVSADQLQPGVRAALADGLECFDELGSALRPRSFAAGRAGRRLRPDPSIRVRTRSWRRMR